MKRAQALAASLACAASMATGGSLHAQVHKPATREARGTSKQLEKPSLVLSEVDRSEALAEMQAWLERLVGLFRVDVRRTRRDPLAMKDIAEEVGGTAKCSIVGAGPGVRCNIRYIRLPPVSAPLAGPPRPDAGNGQPLLLALPILYFGIDPDSLEIQAMAVHVQGVNAQSGMLRGDTVSLSSNWKVCDEVWNTCYLVSEVTAKPAGEIFMKMAEDRKVGVALPKTKTGHYIDLELQLHRELPADAQVQ